MWCVMTSLYVALKNKCSLYTKLVQKHTYNTNLRIAASFLSILADFNLHPFCVLRFIWCDSVQISAKRLLSEYGSPWAVVRHHLLHPTLSRFSHNTSRIWIKSTSGVTPISTRRRRAVAVVRLYAVPQYKRPPYIYALNNLVKNQLIWMIFDT